MLPHTVIHILYPQIFFQLLRMQSLSQFLGLLWVFFQGKLLQTITNCTPLQYWSYSRLTGSFLHENFELLNEFCFSYSLGHINILLSKQRIKVLVVFLNSPRKSSKTLILKRNWCKKEFNMAEISHIYTHWLF